MVLLGPSVHGGDVCGSEPLWGLHGTVSLMKGCAVPDYCQGCMWCSLREPGEGGGEGRIRRDRVSGLKSRNLTWFCSSASTNNKALRTVFVVQFESLKRRMWMSMAQFLSSAGYDRPRRYMGPLTRFLAQCALIWRLRNGITSAGAGGLEAACPALTAQLSPTSVWGLLRCLIRPAGGRTPGWHTGRLVQRCVRHRLTSLHHSPAKSQTDGP